MFWLSVYLLLLVPVRVPTLAVAAAEDDVVFDQVTTPATLVGRGGTIYLFSDAPNFEELLSNTIEVYRFLAEIFS